MMMTATKARGGYSGARAARVAAMSLFCDPLPECCLRLTMLRKSEWKSLLRWLDVSGLALYFFDRVVELQMSSILPAAVLARLQNNLRDNTQRMRDLLSEFSDLHEAFQRAGLSYATAKGFALWPDSVSRPELRAREILEARGYHVHAAGGKSWEFKANEIAGLSLRDLYTPSRYRCVELHLEEDDAGTRLQRRERRSILGVEAPVLSAVDQFIDQGMHLYKHITRDFFRLSHLLEFRRQVERRRGESDFWRQLEAASAKSSHIATGLGVVILLVSQVQGNFAPQALTQWTVDSLPPGAGRWVERYGKRLAFANFPGTKLGMMLQRELPATATGHRALSRSLVPLRLPPSIVKVPERESVMRRLRRRFFELRYVLFRLRFHVVEGARYVIESARWNRYKVRIHRLGAPDRMHAVSGLERD
jgi:hypothetical protein